MALKVPQHLAINGRGEDQNFLEDDRLYRGFEMSEYDFESKKIKLETLKFPDLSCNWDRYSSCSDVVFRERGRETDGCYSVDVVVTRFSKRATPVHDPIDHEEYPNYAHVEVRVYRETDPDGFLPPKRRDFNNKAKKLEYRQNMINELHIEFMPQA